MCTFFMEFNMKKYLDLLYKLALKAYKNDDIPVSAILIKNDKIVATGYNNRHKKVYVLGHAEINAIIEAEKKIKDFRLDGYTMVTTLKPCKMCQAVIEAARISKVYYILDCKEEKSYQQVKYKKLDKIDNQFIENYSKLFNNFFRNIR